MTFGPLTVLLAASAVAAAAVADPVPITPDSAVGRNLLQQARRLDQNNNEWINFNWVTGYSVKFQGCHHIKQWNDEANDEEEVRIQTKRLVRFRLCPADSCSATKAAGCTKEYGDYIVDMDTFLASYVDARKEQIEYDCEYQINYVCNCENADNEEYCQYDCLYEAGMEECIENNPYNDDEQEEEQLDLEDFIECQEVDVDNGRRRRLEDGEEVRYYIGPYCSMQGGEIELGLFADDTCTEFAENVTYRQLTGTDLPFEGVSLVDEECMSCQERQEDNNQNDQQDADEVTEHCELLYINAGKCEAKLPEGTVYQANNAGCNYMEGIRVVRQDGIVDTGSTRSSAVATAFIVIFAMAFAAMAFYVWYLRTRLGVKKNALLSP